MNLGEKMFLKICFGIFCLSFASLCVFVMLQNDSDLFIEPYSGVMSCNGSCSFRANVLQISDRNSTLFFKLSRQVDVDGVFFVGGKKPNISAGDCIQISGSAQEFKGKQSFVINTLRRCS